MGGKRRQRFFGRLALSKKIDKRDENAGVCQASTYHALVVIFLEFFAWGLLTSPVISILNETFPKHTFLMNGLIQGVKGILSFLSAPLIGALSDVWGRKPFLLLTVTFTCAPIPLMHLSVWWYFAMLSISGIFSVTFSIVFAFVADITSEDERVAGYGLVSATFAASLVTSPALGAYLQDIYSESVVIWIATAIALLDILFILVVLPESLPEKLRPASWSSAISWEKADPFGALRKVSHDQLIMLLSVAVFLSYLPEAGEYSSIFIYLRLVMHFTKENVASYIAIVGVLSVLAQTLLMSLLMRYFGHKRTIMIGLLFEIIQLCCYGFASEMWILWLAGCMAAVSSLTYPSISSFVSAHACADQQGAAQGIVTGVRSLCNGLGPACFGCIFYLFHINLSESDSPVEQRPLDNSSRFDGVFTSIVPGPPFAIGSVLGIMALIVAAFMPENPAGSLRKSALFPSSVQSSTDHKTKSLEAEPLMCADDVQL